MKTLLSFALALALAAPLAAEESARPLTLADALATALARYPGLEAARQGIDSARARTLQARAAQLPQVRATAGYQFTDPLSYVDISTPTGAFRIYQQTHDNYDIGLGVQQLVTDFGRTDAMVRLARTGEQSAADTLEQARQAVGYQAIVHFYTTLLLHESVAVADEELRALREALRIAQQRQAAGSATKFDVLTTQVRLADAENRRSNVIASRQREEARLRQILGDESGAPLTLQGEFHYAPAAADRTALLTEARERRPELRLAHDAEQAAQHRPDAAARADRPTLGATLSGGARDGYAPSLDRTKGYVNAGVTLSVPIFTGHRTEGEQRESRAELRAAQSRTRELELTVVGDIDAALADLTASESRLANAETLVAQAQEALALAQSRYERGVVTNFELLDAQSAARAAELSRLQARYDCVINQQMLARAVGRTPAP